MPEKQDNTFEIACAEMERSLERELTPEERSAMRLSQDMVKPAPFVVERRGPERD